MVSEVDYINLARRADGLACLPCDCDLDASLVKLGMLAAIRLKPLTLQNVRAGEIRDRNAEMRGLQQQGVSYREIAKRYQISKARVSQILGDQHQVA